MALSVDIEKRLGNFYLKVKFEAGQDVFSLLGPSGCGKSMTLKCIAGIEKPDKGRIVLDGVILFDSEKKINVPPRKRNVGYLFQEYALFPHMNVEQNIGCGVREKENRHRAVEKMINMMELEGLEKKKPHQLSGGQQQRVALARILVNEPKVLLLDEPFSALDSELRLILEKKTKEILNTFDGTVLFVSHDKGEVYRLAENIGMMADGSLQEIRNKKEMGMPDWDISIEDKKLVIKIDLEDYL